jgi:hypothetical protein
MQSGDDHLQVVRDSRRADTLVAMQPVPAQWRAMWILYVAMFVAMLVEAGVSVWAGTQPPPSTQPFALAPTIVLGMFGAIAAIEMLVVLPLFWRSKMAQRPPSGSDETAHRLSQVRSLLILAWALANSVTIYGVVLAFLYHRLDYFAPFGGAGLLGLIVLAPRERLLDAAQPVRDGG